MNTSASRLIPFEDATRKVRQLIVREQAKIDEPEMTVSEMTSHKYRPKKTEKRKIAYMEEKPLVVNGTTMTRGEISRRTGISITQVSRIFSGKRSPSFHAAKLICWSFGVIPDANPNIPPRPAVTLDQLYDFLVAKTK